MLVSSMFRFFGLLVMTLAWPLTLGAQGEPMLPEAPGCEPVCAYETMVIIPAPSTLRVPTVVEQPLPPALAREGGVAVRASSSGAWIPSRVVVERTELPARVSVFDVTENRPLPVLSDNRLDTNFTFPLRPDLTGRALLTLRADKPVTVSALAMTLATNVAAPRSVSVSIPSQSGIEEIILAPVPPSADGVVRFPETTAREFFITLTYNQPLRLAEINLFEQDPTTRTEAAVRFLATPGESYRVFLQPDREVEVPITMETPDLMSDEDVVVLPSRSIVPNPLYTPADQDGDGVLDQVDNCVVVSNGDQVDVDGNGTGDACDDFDRDGRMNSVDNCPEEPNRDQRDEDGDGVGDVCDGEESRFTEQYAFIPWAGMGFAALVLLGLFAATLRQARTRQL